MRIAVIGTGYVGLVSGACFADFGHDVTCVDKDAAKIAGLNAGRIPICEPGLDDARAPTCEPSRLFFTTDLRGRSAAPRPCSLQSARRRAAATAMPISASCSRPPGRSPSR